MEVFSIIGWCLCILFFRNRSEPHLIILFAPSFCQYQLKSADSRSLSLRSSSLQNAWPLQPSLCPSTKGVNASAPHVASGICWRSLQQPPAADTPAWGKTIVGLAKAVIGRGHQQELFEFEHWGDENLGWRLVPSMDWPHHNACSHSEAAGHLVKKIWGPLPKNVNRRFSLSTLWAQKLFPSGEADASWSVSPAKSGICALWLSWPEGALELHRSQVACFQAKTGARVEIGICKC